MTLLDPMTSRWLHTSDPGYWKFAEAVEALGYPPSELLDSYMKQRFVKIYEEREYHGIGHILYILGGLEEYRPELTPRQKNIMTVAAFFHDLNMEDVYPVENSAREARYYMEERGFKKEDTEEVIGLIEATATDALPGNPDEQIFRDTDWRILGSTPAVYNYYVASLMVEIGGCAEIFQEGRARFLEYVLDKKVIFHTKFWREQREEQARANMKRELAWRGVKVE